MFKGEFSAQGKFLHFTTSHFHYHELDIADIYRNINKPFVVHLEVDTLVTTLNVQQINNFVQRKIIASILYEVNNENIINKKIYTFLSTNGEVIQTNLELINNKLFLKYKGIISYEYHYSAFVKYLISTPKDSLYERSRTFTFISSPETMPPLLGSGGGGVTIHNDLTGRDVPNTHPATSITNTPFGNITETTVQGAINQLDTRISSIPTPITVHNDLTGRNATDAHPASSVSYNTSAPYGDLKSDNVQNAIQELGALMGRELRTGTITRNPQGKIESMKIVHEINDAQTKYSIFYNLDGYVEAIIRSYKNSLDVPYYEKKITIIRDANNTITGWVVTQP